MHYPETNGGISIAANEINNTIVIVEMLVTDGSILEWILNKADSNFYNMAQIELQIPCASSIALGCFEETKRLECKLKVQLIDIQPLDSLS
jgi:hypothetical protein